MNEQDRGLSLSQGFECYRLDSAACSRELFPIPPHSHYFSETVLVRSGNCRIVRGNNTHLLAPGDLIYISPLVRHSIESADGGPVVFDTLRFSASRLLEIPTYLSDLRSFALDAAHAQLPIHMTAEEVTELHLDSIILECIVESERRRFAWDLHIRALIYLLITGLARFWISKRESMADQIPTEWDPILDIPAYIEHHISEPLRVEDLAARCSLSYPWFAKRFRDIFGLSCKQCIMHIRTEAVEQYLVYTDLDLADISSRTGFTDCSHMVKDFRRMTGITPGQYRSMMKVQGRAPFSCFSGETAPNRPSKG